MAHVDFNDFVRAGPGTLAGRYLRAFWQPVAHSHDVGPGEAIPRRIMSEGFTLYRGESGTAHLVAFRCAHRGMQLSTGWIEDDCIRCQYHGWKYDASGQCVEQPAEATPFASKVQIASYPTRDYLGLVFAYLGEGDPPPFPRYPEFEGGLLEWPSLVRRCNYFNNLENSLDVSHVGFVHRSGVTSFDGLVDSPKIFEATESVWGIEYYVEHPSGKKFRSQFGMPNSFHHLNFPRVPELVKYSDYLTWWVPIDDENHYNFSVSLVHLTGDHADKYIALRDERLAKRELAHQDLAELVLEGKLKQSQVDLARTDPVRFEDDIVQVGQGRIADREHERLGRADTGVIMIRKLWLRELRALADGQPLKQWTYDPEKLQPLARVRT